MTWGKRKDGQYYCKYQTEVDGQKKWKWEYFGKSPSAALQAEKRNNELKSNGTIRPYEKKRSLAGNLTFEDLALEYLRIKTSSDLSKKSGENLTYALISVIIPELGHLQAAGLTYGRLNQYVGKRLKTKKMVRKGTKSNPRHEPIKNPDGSFQMISRSSVNRELCDIQAILNWGVQNEFLLKNPIKGFKKPKRDDAIIKPPDKRETQKILSESADHLIRALKISYFTGLRPGDAELFGLTWDDIDFENETIFIVSAKKRGLPHRTVPIHPELMFDLRQWHREDKSKTCREIITWQDKPVKSVDSAFAGAKRRAGIHRRIRLYDFRHAFVTNILSAGGDLKSVSEIAGHSRPDTTQKIYQHTNIELHRQQIAKVPSLKDTKLN
ncbi:MAG: site-specific integrase [Desulfobacteraceae bacterium]|nr:site-specific integrase [Desulfobacteraceae bacterium]